MSINNYNLGINPSTVEYNRIYRFNSRDFDFSSVFKKYLANRGGREDNGLEKHIQSIVAAIIEDGGTEHFPPIIVDINTMQIVDGNCRFSAIMDVANKKVFKNIVMSVVFINVPEEEFDDYVIRYNEGHRNWTLKDYIYNLEKRGVSSLGKFIDFCESTIELYDKKGIKPRYGAAALAINHASLKKRDTVITDEQIEKGRIVAEEAHRIKMTFSEDSNANGGGWYEPFLRAYAEFRFVDNVLGDITFDVYYKKLKELVKKNKSKANVPYGSNKKSDWSMFFRNIRTYVDEKKVA